MKKLFDHYNLTVYERRFTVIVGLVILLIIHVTAVHPYFAEWGEIRSRNQAKERQLAIFQTKLKTKDALSRQLTELESTGANVIPDARSSQLLDDIRDKAKRSNFKHETIVPQRTSDETDQKQRFFEQKAYSMNGIQTGIQELVAFLEIISSEDSAVCCRDLTLKPARGQSDQLDCSMTLVGFFQLQPSENTDVQR